MKGYLNTFMIVSHDHLAKQAFHSSISQCKLYI